MADTEKDEVRRNYEAFLQKLPTILASHYGKIALMHKGEIVAFFDTIADANVAGQKLFAGQPFSMQEVTDLPIDLGFFSHALPQRPV
jgi:hypothetical protein